MKELKFTSNDAMKEIRLIAKNNGLTFKRQNATINGKQAYKFISRLTGQTIISNCTLWSAYSDCMSGYVDEHNQY